MPVIIFYNIKGYDFPNLFDMVHAISNLCVLVAFINLKTLTYSYGDVFLEVYSYADNLNGKNYRYVIMI